jgi:hypothetical protein
LAETFKGPFIVTKVNENGTIKIKTKYGQHDQLVNQNQLVKYIQPKVKIESAPENKDSEEGPRKRAYKKKEYPGREDGGPVTRSKTHPVSELKEVGGAPKTCKHSEKINLITSEQLKDPSQTFEVLIKKVASEEALQKRLRLANFSKEIIQQLNSEQLTTLQESLKSEAALWKQSFKFINKEQHQIGPSYIADKFGLPEHTKTEPCWVHSRRQFLELLPPGERNILLTGDPDQTFDPFSYIWCYTYPQIAAQNPILQAHFQHILQFENNIEDPQLPNHPDPEPVQDQIEPEFAQPVLPPPTPVAPKRGRPLGSKNKPKSEQAAPAPTRDRRLRRTTPKVDHLNENENPGILDSICTVASNNSRASSPNSEWTLVKHRKPRPTRTPGDLSKNRRVCNRCRVSPCPHSGTLGSPNPNSGPSNESHQQIRTQHSPRNPNALPQGQLLPGRRKSRGICNIANTSEPVCDKQLKPNFEPNQKTDFVSKCSPSTITSESQDGQTIRVHIWACRDSLCNGQCSQNIAH